MSKTANRYLVVHGHFYQPPRENPWIESVEVQDSAAPYHDWNERITAECYARNGASRIVNKDNQIMRIVNNYARMSFNFGPTLLSWLEEHAPLTYKSVLDADKESAERFSGHGSAMAQVYCHVILPLASRRDKELQVRWGVADFEHRFGRKPEGMWLAETAVDTESLEVLAEEGIRFTVLAPHQCAAVRCLAGESDGDGSHAELIEDCEPAVEGPPATGSVNAPIAETLVCRDGQRAWQMTAHADVDTRRPYLVRLPSGRSIAVFFYDGPRSRAIAFERLLDSGEAFAQRLAGGFSSDAPPEPELVHVATDGESYGHHHRYGEMALTYALQYVEEKELAAVTNYGELLAHVPPRWEARIAEATSWSCAHGVERWRSDCGCNGGRAGWNQRPLRLALDQLRDAVAPLAATLAAEFFKDWEGARDRYIQVILDRSRADRFLRAERVRPLTKAEEVRALELLEMVRHLQLMYTSCGWFFDDISGIETVQIIAYAARVLELADHLFGREAAQLEPEFLVTLSQAQSNVGSEGSGAAIYRRRVAPLKVGLLQVGAHYAVSSVFTTYGERARMFAFQVHNCGQQVQNSGRGRLVSGEVEIRSMLTHEAERMFYAVLHFGDQNIAAGVKPLRRGSRETYTTFAEEARLAMLHADLPAVIRIFDREFHGMTYTIHSLFTDEQRRVIRLILSNTISEAEESLIHLYDDHASLLRFLSEADVPRPSALALAANFAVNINLRRALEGDPIDAAQVRAMLAAAQQDSVELNRAELSYSADERMRSTMERFAEEPGNSALLESALTVAQTLRLLPFPANIWQAQNIWHAVAVEQQQQGGRTVSDVERFRALGEALDIDVPAMETELSRG
jgi:alpha-amylase/alpha-mannosidase (GH57 family)